MNLPFSLKKSFRNVLQHYWSVATLLLLLAATPAFADWPNTNATKWVQYPNETQTGYDISMRQPFILASDFLCTNTGPITDIHLWASWLNDNRATNLVFTLGFWSDLPAGSLGTNYSRPGTNLWVRTFANAQYQVRNWRSNVNESFVMPEPSPGIIIGADSNIWQYNFYPTNPFIQYGSTAAPTTYWLSVSVSGLTGPNALTNIGWKTATNYWMDDSVFARVGGFGTNLITAWQPIVDPTNPAISLDLSFALTTTNPPPGTNTVIDKWLQIPDTSTNGLDVKATDPKVLASDFLCNATGPITEIRIWTSWRYDQVAPLPCFNLGIWTDIPAITNTPFYSRPGQQLCNWFFGPNQYTNFVYSSGTNEQFFDPNIPGIIGFDTVIWEYVFRIPTNQACIQTNGNIYWLSVTADCFDTNTFVFGWKTCPTNWNDDSVFGDAPFFGAPPPFWYELRRPPYYTNSLDLAFQITTETNPPPPTNTVIDKWLQIPDTSTNGLDVKATDPKVLASDFLCNATGPITQIRIWGSWRYDSYYPAPCFNLGIWTDIPAITNTPFYSRPGQQLCNWQFGPGQYTYFPYTNGVNEQFFDPNIPGIIGFDTVIWEYVFNIPTNQACIQTNGNIYWLSVTADCFDTNTFVFGWKTCPTNWNDDSVFGDAPFFGAPPPFWYELRRPPFYTNSLDLAFQILTETNGQTNPCPPFPVACPVDKTVQCGSSWSFDPPLVGPDPCCPTNPTVIFNASTNAPSPCGQIITGTWLITNCLGYTVYCTQVVTVVDTVAPIITCTTNKDVQCNSVWNFDPPTATDACCGTNVTINVLNTITNGICPRIATRTWQAVDCCTNFSAICTQAVTIVDTNFPSITCPTNMIVLTCDTNVSVTWSLSATDLCSSVTVTSSPPSGTLFLPNTTNTVIATATDACGNTNLCSFTVAIRRPVLGILTIARLGTNQVTLNWTNGILQHATNVLGPYVDLLSATPPYTTNAVDAVRFYRLRCNSP